ncbi:unnamed protein product [Merluccius merluccius]
MDNDQRRGGAASRQSRDASSHDTKNKFNHRQVPEEREQGPSVSAVARGNGSEFSQFSVQCSVEIGLARRDYPNANPM